MWLVFHEEMEKLSSPFRPDLFSQKRKGKRGGGGSLEYIESLKIREPYQVYVFGRGRVQGSCPVWVSTPGISTFSPFALMLASLS